MSYGLRLAVVALAAFSVTSLATSAVVPWIWKRVPASAPATRADFFFLIRLLPTLAGLLAASLTFISFVVFEPTVPSERIGVVLFALAAAGAAALAWSAGKLIAQWITTQRLVRAWPRMERTDTAGQRMPEMVVEIVDTAFPIVALVGVVRPRLVVARAVLVACQPDEWQAIVAHEQGHLVRRDNLRRALVSAAPDLIARFPAAARFADDWHQATEEAADEQAATLGERGRVNLAQALIRVARLAPAHARALHLPASALYRGENIDRRVRGLLAPPLPAVPAPPVVWRLGAAALVLLGLALTVGVVQMAIEGAVEYLP